MDREPLNEFCCRIKLTVPMILTIDFLPRPTILFAVAENIPGTLDCSQHSTANNSNEVLHVRCTFWNNSFQYLGNPPCYKSGTQK